MAEKGRKTSEKRRRAEHELLDFERSILELEDKILELEDLSAHSDLNLNGEIKPLKDRLARLVTEVFMDLSPWQEVQVARAPGRPLTTDYLDRAFDEFLELHGDRNFRDDRSVLTALARIGDHRVLVVAHRKGHDTREKIAFNFGCAHPEGYRKALRKMRLAEKFRLPVVSLINTPGAYPGVGAEERGQAWAIAENLMAMFSLKVPIICVVIGEGGSGGALGIGIADRVLMLDHAYYSVISPEGCAAILWKDAKRAPEAAKALKLSSRDLKRLGVADEIIPEPGGAAHREPEATIQKVREAVISGLDELKKLPVEVLLQKRYEKFRAIGTLFGEAPLVVPDAAPDAVPEEEPQTKEEA